MHGSHAAAAIQALKRQVAADAEQRGDYGSMISDGTQSSRGP